MLDPADGSAHAILDALDSGLIVLDQEHRVTGWNAWLVSASGIAVGEAIGRTIEEVFPDQRLQRLTLAIDASLDQGSSTLLSHALHPRLLPLKTRAGRPLLHNLAVRPVGGRPYGGCIVQVADITLAAEREAILRQRQNARYDAVVDGAPDAILTFDAEGRVQMANPAAEREFGYPAEELIGQTISQILQDPSPWDEAWSELMAGESGPWPVELVLRRKDGSASSVDASACRWLSDARVFVTAIFREVNARRAAEADLRRLNETLEERVLERTAELQKAHDQLRQSQKMEAIGQLTGGVAHDFNNLLTPILGGLDILQRRGMPDARSQRLIDAAMQSAERARTLVQRLLAFARRQPLRPGAVDVRELVDSMSDLVGSLGPHIRVATDIAPGTPAVLADRNQLEMAILNLAVNARDAMPAGGTVTISAAPADGSRNSDLPPGAYVRLSVTDTGEGMDAETLRRATEPFFSTKGIGKGTGLGLSMIHGLAAQLGGALELSSTLGVGTAVSMWLPVAAIGAAVDTAILRGADRVCGAGTALLLDDEDLVRASTAQMLAELGYEVIEAGSAKEALPHLENQQISLIVTDHLMPGITGVEFAREVQARRHPAPVLIISGYAELDDLAPDLPRLTKPFKQVELSDALKQLPIGVHSP